jgi:hypothetical protein
MARLNPPSTFAATQCKAHMLSIDSLPDCQCQPCLRSNSPASSSASKRLARRRRTPNFEWWPTDPRNFVYELPLGKKTAKHEKIWIIFLENDESKK